jgi:hypothetical protein
MPQNETPTIEPRNAGSSGPVRNPYIINFCKVLVEKKGENLEGDALKKLLNDMYRLFECMLGQNMIEALPPKAKEEYTKISEDLSKLSYEKIGEIFDKNIPNHEEVMKGTMKQFAEIFMKNREFDVKDYPVPLEVLSDS